MSGKQIRIIHRQSGSVVAEGPLGWGITPFDGAYYIRRKYFVRPFFQVNYRPGICPYKFLYFWADLHLESGDTIRNAGWLYWLPNPLFPFIWFRFAVSRDDEQFLVDEYAQ